MRFCYLYAIKNSKISVMENFRKESDLLGN